MLVYLAILMPVLLLCCGLVVDVGAMQFKRLQMQSACDAASMAAELEIERGSSSTAWVTAARGDAGVNGFTNGSNNVTVTAALQPTSGAFLNFYDAVQTTVSQPQYTSFLKLLGKDPTTINVRSVAIVPPCVYLMGQKSLTQYELSTTAATINSTVSPSPCPYYVGGQASVDANTSFSAMAENVTSTTGNAWNDTPSAPPRYGATTMADPLLTSITQPSAGGCSTTNYQPGTISSNQTAYAATYCGTTTFSCSSPSIVITLNPGLYVIAGTLNVNSCTLSGTGVTFFYTSYNGSYGQMVLTSTTLNLTAPASASAGGVPGVLVMANRSWTTTNAQDFKLTSSTVRGDGIWYLPGAGMLIDSGVLIGTNYAGIVADNLVVKNSTLTTGSNYSSVQGGNPFRPGVSLAE